MSFKIFISYRRSDTEGFAGRLYDRLEPVYSAERLFIDVDSIDKGDDFVERMKESIASTDVVIALIGDRWLSVVDETGTPRLNDPADPVRIELETAIAERKIIIPVTVGRAEMPRERELPASLMPLARRNAHRLSHDGFAADVRRLCQSIDAAVVKAAELEERKAREVARLAAERAARLKGARSEPRAPTDDGRSRPEVSQAAPARNRRLPAGEAADVANRAAQATGRLTNRWNRRLLIGGGLLGLGAVTVPWLLPADQPPKQPTPPAVAEPDAQDPPPGQPADPPAGVVVKAPEPLFSIEGHKDRIEHVAFSPSGSLVATASLDKTARLWGLGNGACVGAAARASGCCQFCRVLARPDLGPPCDRILRLDRSAMGRNDRTSAWAADAARCSSPAFVLLA